MPCRSPADAEGMGEAVQGGAGASEKEKSEIKIGRSDVSVV